MSKTRNLSKVLALVIMLALVIGILPMGAMAAIDRTSRTFYNDSNVAVSTVTVSGSGITVAGISDWTLSSATDATFVVALSPNCSLTSVNVSIVPVSGTSGSATLAVDQTTNNTILAGGITYTVFVQKEAAYLAAGSGRNAYIGAVSGEDATLTYNGTATINSHTTYKYTAAAPASGYPYPVSLRIIPGGTSYDNTSYTFSVTSTGATLKNFVGTYFLATFGSDGANLDFSITTNTNNTKYYRITFNSSSSSGSAANGVEAYLPAPGQFTNEGIGTGGWGSVFPASSTTTPKAMVNAISSTGVSLGSFGGYVVFNVGVDDNGKDKIQNDEKNPCGVDFIIYGNAFNNNSEPACVQVYGTTNGTTYAWYDIAGSLHYNSATKWNVEVTYTNPTPADDKNGATSSNRANVDYTIKQNNVQIGNGTIFTNTFHNHSWYPLHRNYFANGMDYLASLGFGTHVRNASTGAGTLMLKGTLLESATNTQTANYAFGYADVHPNGSSYGNAVNPYASPTTGGDGIDLAWAVDTNGVPVKLLSARKVRVYTGTTAMNGMFGEISSEICGIYVANKANSAVGTTTKPSSVSFKYSGASNSHTIASGVVPANGGTISRISNICSYAGSATELTVTVNATSGSTVYVNDLKLTEGTSGVFTGTIPTPASNEKIRILVQEGSKAPYLFVII